MNLRQAVLRGAKGSAGMAILAMVTQYLVAWMLARHDPRALGAYSLIMLVTATVTTFVMIGGNVFAPFFGRLPDRPQQLRLALEYFAVVFVIGLLLVGGALVGRDVLHLPALARFDMPASLLAVLAPCVMIVTFVSNVESSSLAITRAAVLQRLPLLLTGGVLVAASLADVVWTRDRVLLAVTASFAAAAVLCLFRVVGYVREATGAVPLGAALHKDFVRYVGSVQLSTMNVFVYENLERALILTRVSGDGLTNLGLYAAAQMINTIVLGVGRQLSFALFPVLSHARGNAAELRALYATTARYSVLIMGSLCLVLLGAVRPILVAFGPRFAEQHVLLVVLLLTTALMSAGSVTSSLMMAIERAGAFTIGNAAMVAVYATLAFVLAPRLGLPGIAVGQLVAQALLQAWMLYRLHVTEGIAPPRAMLVFPPFVIAQSIIAVTAEGPWMPAVSALLALSGFLLTAGVTVGEVRQRAVQLAGRR